MYKDFYELKNGVPTKIDNPLKVVVANPSKKTLEALGYNPKTYREDENIPEYNPETQYLEATYVETDTEIVKTYVVKEIENIELPEMNEGVEETISEEGETDV